MSIITIVVGRRIVTHLNHSKPAQENLKLIQTKLCTKASINSRRQYILEQHILNGWLFRSSTSVLERKRTISLYISDTSDAVNFRNLSERQWDFLEKCLALLHRSEITKVRSSYSCVSEVNTSKYLNKEEVQISARMCPLSRPGRRHV